VLLVIRYLGCDDTTLAVGFLPLTSDHQMTPRALSHSPLNSTIQFIFHILFCMLFQAVVCALQYGLEAESGVAAAAAAAVANISCVCLGCEDALPSQGFPAPTI
jgi:hypothetical protein